MFVIDMYPGPRPLSSEISRSNDRVQSVSFPYCEKVRFHLSRKTTENSIQMVIAPEFNLTQYPLNHFKRRCQYTFETIRVWPSLCSPGKNRNYRRKMDGTP